MQINLEHLRSVTAEKTWRRGELYFEQGLVTLLEQDADSIKASVKGTQRYQVVLSNHSGQFACVCDCPMAASAQNPCKHVVAVSLRATQMISSPSAKAPNTTVKSQSSNMQELVAFIQAQPKEWLAHTLIALADKQPEVQQILGMLRQSASKDNLKELQKSLSSLIGRPRFMDYKQSRSYANKLNSAAGIFEQMLLRGQTADCMTILEYALERVIKVYAQSDDSGGQIHDAITTMGDLYRDACVAASEVHKPTAARIFKLLLVDDWGFINRDDLEAMMGTASVLALEDKICEAWLKQPPRAAYTFDAHTSKVEALVTAIAQKNKDVDLLIRIYSREPVHEHGYLNLIKTCQQFHHMREAVQWAERGLKANPKSNSIRSLLAEMYLQDGLDDEASELLWQNFLQRPEASSYLALKQHSGKAWTHWRQQVMEKLIASEQKSTHLLATRNNHQTQANASLRIACLLAEGSIEEARNLLKTHDCSHLCRRQLAQQIHQQYPDEAAHHLQTIISEITQVSSPRAYEQACELLREMQVWLPKHTFDAYLQDLKVQNKIRPTFIKLLNTI
ncbi:SWIM zinc finger family protein [Methylophilus aquaticus]|uniref:SWIM zinc finger family protein n=1 Tax=Methylophilus aquaticus TaxID=1971610 RepID=A0ABT9JP41_9PROT|nr:SWIM zinc finger family protein [Methylophilus aquaticus]MDP8566342.1 SWIM zinc finger family protein [Methylophilus aquaticus]